VSTDWQIATDSSFTNIVYESLEDTTHLTSIGTLADLGLSPGSEYYIRCRYHSTTLVSEFSTYNRFVMINSSIGKPSITYPTNESTNIPESAIITSSTYNPINHSEPHVSTDWQIATDSSFTNIVYESLEDTTHLTSIGTIKQLGLQENQTYYVRCIYNSTTISSTWSDSVSFTTTVVFMKTEIQQLTGSETINGEYFGAKISSDHSGDIIVVSSGYEAGGGAAYVFKYNSSNNLYSQLQKLTSDDNSGGDSFGSDTDVSSDGSVIIVGAKLEDNSKGDDAGSIYVFNLNTSNGLYEQVQKILPNGGAGYRIGTNVAISSDKSTIVSCSDYYLTGFKGGGEVYKLNQTSGQYEFVQALTRITPVDNEKFGTNCSVSGNGDYVAIGGDSISSPVLGSGIVLVWKWNTSTEQYDLLQTIADPTQRNYDRFGRNPSLSDDGSKLIVSAHGVDQDGNQDSGVSYYYKLNDSTGLYELIQDIFPASGTYQDYIGHGAYLSEDGNSYIVGGYGHDINLVKTGRAWLFVFNSTTGLYEETQILDSSD
jgi:hypothetical protein